MTSPNEEFDWNGLWAGLLQGVGSGLLHYDGSRLAQAALMGLDAYDAAQEQRRHRTPAETDVSESEAERRAEMHLLSSLSPAERAAWERIQPQERDAFQLEMAGTEPRDATAQPRLPLSPNPLDGSWLETILPFGRDGRLKPTWRR